VFGDIDEASLWFTGVLGGDWKHGEMAEMFHDAAKPPQPSVRPQEIR